MKKLTKLVKVGGVAVGGGAPVKIQSMCTVKTANVPQCVAQIQALEQAGCEIIRVSVLDDTDAAAIAQIKRQISIPLVADIHFSADLAIKAMENGCDKVRINPGNIGSEQNIKRVADCVKAHKIPVRVGANTGSIEPEHLKKYGRSAQALVQSALHNASILEKEGVNDIVLSVKASSVPLTVQAYQLLSEQCNYPLHLGVTEAGTERMAVVKSATAFGALLLSGIGDTVRVSITGDPVREIYAAQDILRALELQTDYVNVISCPTCGRCSWDSAGLAERVNARVQNVRKSLKIAVMGCVVNGPGEAKDCHLGIAGGNGYCVIFKNGEIYKKVPAEQAEEQFFKEIDALIYG